jgi:hypothetical protein
MLLKYVSRTETNRVETGIARSKRLPWPMLEQEREVHGLALSQSSYPIHHKFLVRPTQPPHRGILL